MEGSILEAVRKSAAIMRAKAGAASKELKLKAVGATERGTIVLIAATEGSPNLLDLDGEFVDKAGLTKLAFDFCSDVGRTFKANHGDEIDVTLMQTWEGPVLVDDAGSIRTLKAGELITPDTKVVGVAVDEARVKADARSAWFVEVKPSNPELVALAKAGGIAGASWGALVSKVQV